MRNVPGMDTHLAPAFSNDCLGRDRIFIPMGRAWRDSYVIIRQEVQAAGSSKENTDPRPNWLQTTIDPLWASTIALAMASPIPVPCTL